MHDVIIDIGHFNCDSGAVNGSYREVDFTKSISDKVVTNLKKYCLNVGTTSGTLANRTAYENKNGCKIFVSIHCNAGGGVGFESWIYKTGGEAEKIASSINQSYEAVMKMRNRGIKVNPSFYVLKNTKAPAVIFECGFVDSSDLDILRTKQDDIAKGITEGIINYLGVSKTASSNPTEYSVTIPKNVSKVILNID